jgi:hypothetical protein
MLDTYKKSRNHKGDLNKNKKNNKITVKLIKKDIHMIILILSLEI